MTPAVAPTAAKRSDSWRRRFPPTREGWWFLGATLLVGAAAVNGGINLLFLVFGMMLALIIASGILSELCLRDLIVARRVPGAIHAGTAFLMTVAVRNSKRRVPTFSLEVEDLLDGRPVERRCYFLKLPAGRLQETAYKHVLPRRGVHRFTGFRISTRFPFGFIRKSRDLGSPADVLVFPALVPIPDPVLRAASRDLGRQAVPTRSRSGDFHGLREFRSGEDPRDIHWRTSARRGRLLMRESEEETGRTVVVALQDPADGPTNGARSGAAKNPAEISPAAFEGAVSLAASLALALLKQGLAVGLTTWKGFLPPAQGAAQATAILSSLATIETRAAARDTGNGAAAIADEKRAHDLARALAAARGLPTLTVVPGVPLPRIDSGGAQAHRRAM